MMVLTMVNSNFYTTAKVSLNSLHLIEPYQTAPKPLQQKLAKLSKSLITHSETSLNDVSERYGGGPPHIISIVTTTTKSTFLHSHHHSRVSCGVQSRRSSHTARLSIDNPSISQNVSLRSQALCGNFSESPCSTIKTPSSQFIFSRSCFSATHCP
jgi:hypothetical protein